MNKHSVLICLISFLFFFKFVACEISISKTVACDFHGTDRISCNELWPIKHMKRSDCLKEALYIEHEKGHLYDRLHTFQSMYLQCLQIKKKTI